MHRSTRRRSMPRRYIRSGRFVRLLRINGRAQVIDCRARPYRTCAGGEQVVAETRWLGETLVHGYIAGPRSQELTTNQVDNVARKARDRVSTEAIDGLPTLRPRESTKAHRRMSVWDIPCRCVAEIRIRWESSAQCVRLTGSHLQSTTTASRSGGSGSGKRIKRARGSGIGIKEGRVRRKAVERSVARHWLYGRG